MSDKELMNHQQKDTNLREALARRARQRPVMPADLNKRVMARMAEDGLHRQKLHRWVAVAACLLVIVGVGVTLMVKMNGHDVEKMTAKVEKEDVASPVPSGKRDTSYVEKESTLTAGKMKTDNFRTLPSNQIGTAYPNPRQLPASERDDKKTASHANEIEEKYSAPSRNIDKEDASDTPLRYYPMTQGNGGYLRYASATIGDSIVYRAPSMFDEFIAKMAENNGAEKVALDCTDDRGGIGDSDSGKPNRNIAREQGKEGGKKGKVVSVAYVFPDGSDVDVFGRLLQMACWYDNKTPGYLLNFSRQQFFFCINDIRQGERYLWTAERIAGNRILVYCTHSPQETVVSSACYQEYKDRLNLIEIKN